VFIYHGQVSADLITSVTYGGVAMTRVNTAKDTVDEPGGSYCYFLGSGIPTGAQTVSIDHTATTTTKIAVCITITADSDTIVAASGIVENNVADPSVALDSGADVAIRYACLWSGNTSPTNLAVFAAFTEMSNHDFGVNCGEIERETTPSSGSVTAGWTVASEDVGLVALAIKESAPPALIFPPTSQPYRSQLEVVDY
jgi:hypothetical protein